MPKLISELKEPYPLVWLAACVNKQLWAWGDEEFIAGAFDREESKEGWDFWDLIGQDKIKEAKKLQPHLFRTKRFIALKELEPWPKLHAAAEDYLERNNVFDGVFWRWIRGVNDDHKDFWLKLSDPQHFDLNEAIDMRPDLFGLEEIATKPKRNFAYSQCVRKDLRQETLEPSYRELVSDLPGMWHESDFIGGVEERRGPSWIPLATGPDQPFTPFTVSDRKMIDRDGTDRETRFDPPPTQEPDHSWAINAFADACDPITGKTKL